MKVGVTGAAGFVGSWLIPELRDHGHDVVGCDRLPGPLVNDRLDLLDPGAVRDWVGTHRLDAVCHLAAQVGRAFGEDDLSRTVRCNAEATTLVGQACAEFGAQVLYTSTSEVYGDHGDADVDEFAELRLPGNLYGLSKRWGEEALARYAPRGLVVCRLSMPYGPGSPPGRGRRAMDTMLWQAHHGMPMTVHRGAERSWCWIGDTVAGIRLALEHNAPGRQPDGPAVYNIGRDDDPRSMRDIALRACDIAGVPDREADGLIHMVDPPAGQILIKRLVTARIRALGWKPTVQINEGMGLVYDWVCGYDRDGHRVAP